MTSSVLRLQFFEGKRGDIISRLPSGKVAVVNRRAKRTPSPRETWLCRVDKELSNVAIVTPLQRVVKKIKKIEVYDEYACGHRVLRRIDQEEVEVPENEVLLPEVRVWKVPKLCPECLKKFQESCKHEQVEINVWPFGFIIRCNKCDKVLYTIWNSWERSLFDLPPEELKEVEERIKEIKEPKIRQQAEKVFREYRDYIEEYNKMTEEAKKLEKQIGQVLQAMARVLGAKDVKVEGNKVLAWFGEYTKVITSTIGKPSGKTYEYDYEPLYREVKITPELEELLCKYEALTKMLQEVEHWLTVNRPTE